MRKALFSSLLVCALMASAFAQDSANKQPTATPTVAAATAPQTFTDYQMGMAFDYPSTWTLVMDPNAKKDKKGFDINRVLGKRRKKNQPVGPKQINDETL